MKLSGLEFGFFKSKKYTILQTESTECGLACIAMILNYHGSKVELRELRYKFPVSLKGMTLGYLTKICNKVGLANRPLKIDVKNLKHLNGPSILHWNFNHYVVLYEIKNNKAIILDPALGERNISLEELSKYFTGVAVEVWPKPDFVKNKKINNLKLRDITGELLGFKTTLLYVIGIAIVLELVSLILPFYMQLIVDDVIASKDFNFLLLISIVFIVLYCFKNFVLMIRSWLVMYIGTKWNVQWKNNIVNHLVELPVSFFEKRHVGDITSRLGSVDIIQKTITGSLIESLLDGLISFVLIFILFYYKADLALLIILSAILYALLRFFWFYPFWTANKEEIIYSARQQTYILETIRGIKSIKLFGKENLRSSTWLTLFIDQTNAKIKTQKYEVYYKFIKNFIFDLQNICVIFFGVIFVLNETLTLGALLALLAYKAIFDTRIVAFIDNFTLLKSLNLQFERLSDIVLTEKDNILDDLYTKDLHDFKIEFENVTFQYAFFEKNILQNLNLEINSGESVAIIGPSGCGKSTLFNLLLGVHKLGNGKIKIGDKDIENIDNDFLRSIISTVLQDDILFGGSIGDNISFYDNEVDYNFMEECARIACIHDDIQKMPMGYHTLVGDMGTVLSGGQKQRVLLARALYKKPKILLLDEATSHLDVKKEYHVSENIKSLNITRVIIAHRPETIMTVDRVLYMEGGKITKNFKPLEAIEFMKEKILN
ncbi:peptidase domain-containing ABC transporter [Acinetobacter pittii]|uniref:peptidase domain-containing ABC transporter n=3 Tax=Acinetobacter calcoaceticus/baumannii complex TaxID=909768 RepID=UPI00397C7673